MCLKASSYLAPHTRFKTFVVQSLSVRLFATPWTAAGQASLSLTFSQRFKTGTPFKSEPPLLRAVLRSWGPRRQPLVHWSTAQPSCQQLVHCRASGSALPPAPGPGLPFPPAARPHPTSERRWRRGEMLETGVDAGEGGDAGDRQLPFRCPHEPHVSIRSCLHPHRVRETGKLGRPAPQGGSLTPVGR